MKQVIFKADVEDIDRVDAKVDRLLAAHGLDSEAVDREIYIAGRQPDC
jgi:hypothetical protein